MAGRKSKWSDKTKKDALYDWHVGGLPATEVGKKYGFESGNLWNWELTFGKAQADGTFVITPDILSRQRVRKESQERVKERRSRSGNPNQNRTRRNVTEDHKRYMLWRHKIDGLTLTDVAREADVAYSVIMRAKANLGLPRPDGTWYGGNAENADKVVWTINDMVDEPLTRQQESESEDNEVSTVVTPETTPETTIEESPVVTKEPARDTADTRTNRQRGMDMLASILNEKRPTTVSSDATEPDDERLQIARARIDELQAENEKLKAKLARYEPLILKAISGEDILARD